MVIYDAKRRKVDTIDSRETAPGRHAGRLFGTLQAAAPVRPRPASSGLSVGVPGTVRGWEKALKRYGTRSLRSLLRPGERIAREGFVVDQTFDGQVKRQRGRLRRLHLDARDLPDARQTAGRVASTHRNPDMADTYERIARRPGPLLPRRDRARHRADRAAPAGGAGLRPPARRAPRPDDPRDLRRYDAIRRKPTKIGYRGLDVFGMGPPSSGGSTVGEALNILEGFRRRGAPRPGAAPLPRGVQARLRRPRRLPRRPGLRRRAAARPALGRLRRRAAGR